MGDYTKEFLRAHVEKFGCYCGGLGRYIDYNCGAAFETTCPHCNGTGKKSCDCEQVSTKCSG